jgi:hypothetical protein
MKAPGGCENLKAQGDWEACPVKKSRCSVRENAEGEKTSWEALQ